MNKNIMFIIILIAVVVLVAGGFYYWQNLAEPSPAETSPQISEEERLIIEQSNEIEQLRQESLSKQEEPPNDEKDQIQELQTLSEGEPLTGEQIQGQFDELEGMRNR